MKYLIVIGSGLTDRPIAEKDNQTPLQIADTPNLDKLAQSGKTGSVQTIPENFEAGDDVSFLSLLGFDPETHHAGTASFDAVALDVVLEEDEIPICCTFVQLQSSHNDMVMKDFTSDNLTSQDSRILLDALQEQIGSDSVRFHAGKGHHNLMVIKSAPFSGTLNPPQELIGEGIRQFMPQGDEFKELIFIMNQAQIILHNHPYNRQLQKEGKDTVNSVWLWGNGRRRTLPSFSATFGKSAALITSSLLFKGMGKSAGMNVVDGSGLNGNNPASYQGSVESALKELDAHDVVYLHIGELEDISLKGDLDDKILGIEDFDNEVAGPLLNALNNQNDVKMLLTVNHVSSAALMKYTKDNVPFLVYPAEAEAKTAPAFDEKILDSGKVHFKDGPALIDAFLKDRL
ncbi:MAG: phosphoglycerate mutase [Nitrospinae bacterium]|nr:phosphoglycerate mutase [Nitrospinota bacterium]